MKLMSPRAAAATALLHAGLIAAALRLPDDNSQHTPAMPVAVRVIPAAEPAKPSAPAPHVPASPPAPAAPPRKQPQPKPHLEATPVTKKKPRQATAASAPHAATPSEPKISAVASPPADAPAAPPATPGPPLRAEPATPTKTDASDAAYAASNRKPPYPRLSRSNDEQGTVVLRVLVKTDGTAGRIEIKTSSGYPLLDKSASTTVQSWRFSPATVNGKPVDEWYEVPIPFKLVDD